MSPPELADSIAYLREVHRGTVRATRVEVLVSEIERLRRDLDYVRTYVRVVLTSPVCHPHNAITLREIVAEIDERLGDDDE